MWCRRYFVLDLPVLQQQFKDIQSSATVCVEIIFFPENISRLFLCRVSRHKPNACSPFFRLHIGQCQPCKCFGYYRPGLPQILQHTEELRFSGRKPEHTVDHDRISRKELRYFIASTTFPINLRALSIISPTGPSMTSLHLLASLSNTGTIYSL